jgi:hypothetical protein
VAAVVGKHQFSPILLRYLAFVFSLLRWIASFFMK